MRVRIRWRPPTAQAGSAGILRRETAALLRLAGVLQMRPYSTVILAIATAVLGVAIPWRRGLDFYDPVMVFAYAVAAVFLAGPAATDLIANEWESARTIFARIGACMLFSCGLFAWLTAAGIATVNYAMVQPALAWPPRRPLEAALVLVAAASMCMASSAALLTVVLGAVAGKLLTRVGIIAALGMLVLGPRLLPTETQLSIVSSLAAATLTKWAYIASGALLAAAAGPILALRGAHR